MKVQCPNCKQLFTTPDEYRDTIITCVYCQESFIAERFKKPLIVVPTRFFRRFPTFVRNLWTKSPYAFRVGFLATLGAIAALWTFLYLYNVGAQIKQTIHTPSAFNIPPKIELYDYEFEDTLDVRRVHKQDFFKIIWRVWFFNSHKFQVPGFCHIEIRDANNSLLIESDPIPVIFTPTGASSDWLPREITGVYWVPRDIWLHGCHIHSKIDIYEKTYFSQKNS